MEEIAKIIPKNFSSKDFIKCKDNKIINSVIQWSANLPQLERFSKFISIAKDHHRLTEEASKATKLYLDVINRFLKDSGKELRFDERGSLCVCIDEQDSRHFTALSSGEAQIFIILTQLYYNPAAKRANVFIIDEPELSLHVTWQELFVDSVMTANPNVRYIMETHSPSIILDRVSACRDLNRLT
jgi:predicted ATP-binding protein involved in virulence